MRFPDLLAMSVNNLRRRKLRTALTVLGVIVGTASIVVMMSLGIGMSEMQMELMESYGSMTAINVYCDTYSQPQGGTDPIYLTDEVVEQIRHMEHVDGISPLLSVGVMMWGMLSPRYTVFPTCTYRGTAGARGSASFCSWAGAASAVASPRQMSSAACFVRCICREISKNFCSLPGPDVIYP